MINLRKTLEIASQTLNQRGIAHALVGGFALAVHGINRATADIDFLADGQRRAEIISLLEAAGFSLKHASNEVLQFSGIGLLNILLANRPASQKMLEHAQPTPQLPVRVLRVEDIIGLKIQAYCNDSSRELQDKADIHQLIKHHPQMDWPRIKMYADLFNEWSTIETLRRHP